MTQATRHWFALGLVAMLLLVIAPPAHAVDWTQQAVPAPQQPNGELASISCHTQTSCIAVGTYGDSVDDFATLAESWNGTAWTLQTTPNPSGATSSELAGVSCPAAGVCTAVGSYVNSSGTTVTLAEAWNGTSWTIQTTPTPSGATSSSLAAVSCTSSSACTAVGSYIDGTGTTLSFAEAWDGTNWTVQVTQNPSGAVLSELQGVSCTASSACIAVGLDDPSISTEVTLAEVWNGITWTVQTTPNPDSGDSVTSSLDAVSCTAATTCTAVGAFSDLTSGVSGSLAEHLSGTSWTLQTTDDPAGSSGGELVGVSCTSGSACSAVGDYGPSGGGLEQHLQMAQTLSGSTWTLQTTPGPSGAQTGSLAGVSCNTTVCDAVGLYSNQEQGPGGIGDLETLAYASSASTWTLESPPNPPGAYTSLLDALSCTSASACVAVGNASVFNSIDNSALAADWNGAGWSLQDPPFPDGAQSSELGGTSCTSSAVCVAVGSYVDSGGTTDTLAETWNSAGWTIQLPVNPAGARSSELGGESCSSFGCLPLNYFNYDQIGVPYGQSGGVSCSGAVCIAVGSYVDSGGATDTLAESWNGSNWTMQAPVNPAGATNSILNGVSCSSPTACTAVGMSSTDGGTSFTTLAESWNGTSWTIETSPNPAGAASSELGAVSCSSATACTAVGSYANGGGTILTLAETWNGTSWTIQSTQNPSGATVSMLAGVSCPAGGSCTAVGSSDNGAGTTSLLAEEWNGSAWSTDTSADPPAAIDSAFLGVSCVSSSTCTGAGFFIGPFGGLGNGYEYLVPLAEIKGAGGGPGGTGPPPASEAPVDKTQPVISGTARAHSVLRCSTGTWSNGPTRFAYQWSRDRTPIEGATDATYTVQSSDEQLTLTCAVTAFNAAGQGATAISRGVTVPVPRVRGCPAATGTLSGQTLGLARLGMTREQARHSYTHSTDRGKHYEDFFCLTPIGVRVGYASPALLDTLPRSDRRQLADRVVWASTSSGYYDIQGVRPGATVTAAGRLLKLSARFQIGLNTWYLAPNGASTGVLKVRHGLVEEIGIADRQLTIGHRAQRTFLKSFS